MPSPAMVVAKPKLALLVSVRLSPPLFCKVTLRPAPSPLSEPPIVAASPPPQPDTPSNASAQSRHEPPLNRIIRLPLDGGTAAAGPPFTPARWRYRDRPPPWRNAPGHAARAA